MDENQTVTPGDLNPEVVPTTSIWARMFNVLATPGEVFTEVKQGPSCTANWLVPALIVMMVGWLGSWWVFSQDAVQQQLSDMTSKQIAKQVEARKMPPEAAESAEKAAKFIAKVTAYAAPPLTAMATPFWYALFIWLVGAKFFKGDVPYMKAVEVAGLSNMVGVVEGVVKTFLIIWTGSIFAGPNLGMLVKEFDAQNTVHGLLAMADAMTFWALAVRGIGLARLSGASVGKSIAWLFGLWLAWGMVMTGVGLALKKAFGG